MAQLLRPAPPPAPAQAPRISQLLPTVKCSSCCQPVPLSELGEHVCPPQPPPSLMSLQKPPMSPKSASSLLPARLQNLVSSRAGTPQQQPQVQRQLSAHDHAPARRPSQHDPFQRIPPSVNNNTLSSPRRNSPAPSLSAGPSARAPPPTGQPTSILISRGNPYRQDSRPPNMPEPERVATPVRNAAPPVVVRTRTPSNASGSGPKSPEGASLPNPFENSSPQPVVGRPRAASLRRDPARSSSQQQQLPPPTPTLPRTRTPSNATSSTSGPPRPSFERMRAPSAASSAPRPSLDAPRPSFDTRARPSFDTPRPSVDRTPSSPAPVARPLRQNSAIPFPSTASIPFPSSPAPAPPPVTRTPVPNSERDIDTKIGGEAGMAGVGRRGFAAAARAAMFAASLPHGHNGVGPAAGPDQSIVGMDGRRANAPKYLDINAAMGNVMRAAMTPPLSPNSGHSRSPVSPYPASPISPAGSSTPTNGQHPDLPLSNPYETSSKARDLPASPRNQKHLETNGSEFVRIASPSRTPSPVSNPFNRRLSGDSEALSVTPGLGPVRLPFFEKYKMQQPVADDKHGNGDESDEESVYTHNTEAGKGDATPMSPSTDSDVGLAYADESEDDTPVVMPLDIRKSSASLAKNKVKFPTLADKQPQSPASSSRTRTLRNDSASSARSESVSSSSYVGPSRARSASAATGSTTKSAGALERAMETLIEEGASVSILASGSVLASMSGPSSSRPGPGKPNRSNTVPGPVSPEYKPPKLPTRSHTSPSHPHVHSERTVAAGDSARVRNTSKGKERRDRVCARCEKKIEDGRWIRMDGGSVLCERCWKNMYLPKCRRCNLPIEKQAVSSSDGQLKGKYHRDCFNCHTCHKPFPDKEFYVFDGKPLCAYHYHEANDSLCAAPSCGQPIEGPCALTHAGRRFHPEHLLCEFEDGCGERLAEYWEVDGQMLCEKHAGVTGSRDGGSSRGDERPDTLSVDSPMARDEGRALKRMTRFIDLGAVEDDEASEVNIL
ncbi:hypothetical protein BV22DRAFT_1032630 [Leucogyrophana mollusca]|uniref:Uncharacterized protein n=1 Tax=Leucogyrophana mollusca TaxID=85980 RepID=A0ACB8BLB6_9AGAM|nr:hypothetical protein BV22DRAFT_1032630 [Leucogyrophana mollusca]